MKICFVEIEPLEREFFATQLGDEVIFADSADEVPADAEILSTFIYTKVDGAFLDAHPQLRLVTTRSTGTDHLDLAECRRRGVIVTYVPSYGENTVAEHTFALILALSRRLRRRSDAKTGALFLRVDSAALTCKAKPSASSAPAASGCTSSASQSVSRWKSSRMTRARQPHSREKIGFRFVPLDELLAASHIISLHCPLARPRIICSTAKPSQNATPAS